jgi:hypothetical protein
MTDKTDDDIGPAVLEAIKDLKAEVATLNAKINAILMAAEIPNAKTIEAMEAARLGELVTVDGVKGLMDYLHADD